MCANYNSAGQKKAVVFMESESYIRDEAPQPTTLALAFGAGGPPVGGRRHQTPTQRRPGHRPPGDRATATGIGGRRLAFQLRFHLIEQPMEGVWLEGPRPVRAICTIAS